MILRSFFLSILALSLSACNISGAGQKGPFKAGSAVTLSKLDAQANPLPTETLSSTTKGSQGRFSINRIEWNGWALASISGQYFNEFTNSNSSNSINLEAITNKNRNFDTVNIHLFSHLAAARIKEQVSNGISIDSAWRTTQIEMKNLFGLNKVGLNIHTGVEQLSLTKGTGKFRSDNANLLLFTGAFLANNGNATLLQNLADDFSDDGQFNGTGESAFNEIAQLAATDGLLTTLSQNLETHGAYNPPNNGDMPELPTWVNTNDSPVNQIPVANNQAVTFDEDTSNNTITLVGTDADGDVLSYTYGQPSNGSLSGSGNNLSYTPTPNFFGADSFTFTVSDGTATSTEATVSITVNDVPEPNTVPVANNQSVTVDEDTSNNTITLSGTDADGDVLSYTYGQPSNGSLSGSGNNLSYTPTPNFFGADSFTFTVNDGTATSTEATISITVNDVPEPNTVPVANNQSVTVDEDTSNNTITLSGTDADGDALSYTYGQPSNGSLSGSGNNLSYTPTPNFFGVDSFTFTVNDGTATSTEATVSITVNDVPEPNIAPVANNQDITVEAESTNNSIILVGTDEDGDSLAYTNTSPLNGTLTGTGANLMYTPNSGYIGNDSFTFTVTDGIASSTGTVNIIVRAVEPLPLAVSGSVIKVDGTGVTGAQINIFKNNILQNSVPIVTGLNGDYSLALHVNSDYTVVVSHDNYATQIKNINAVNTPAFTLDIIMAPTETPQPFNAVDGYTAISNDGITQVTIPSNAFPDGSIDLVITTLNLATQDGIDAIPGNNKGLYEGQTTPSSLLFRGMAEFSFFDSVTKEEVQLQLNQTAEIIIPLYNKTKADGTLLTAGELIPLFYLDEVTGIWIQDGQAQVIDDLNSPTLLSAKANVSHFTWFNLGFNFPDPLTPLFKTVDITLWQGFQWATLIDYAIIRSYTSADIGSTSIDLTVNLNGTVTADFPNLANSVTCFWAEIYSDTNRDGKIDGSDLVKNSQTECVTKDEPFVLLTYGITLFYPVSVDTFPSSNRFLWQDSVYVQSEPLKNFANAKAYCANLNLAGYATGWRLPNLAEYKLATHVVQRANWNAITEPNGLYWVEGDGFLGGVDNSEVAYVVSSSFNYPSFLAQPTKPYEVDVRYGILEAQPLGVRCVRGLFD